MIRFTAGEIAFAVSATLVSLVVGVVTLVAESSTNPLVMDALFFPCAPGLFAGLLITGAHGGTHTQESMAPWIAALVNIVFYLSILLLLRALWSHLKSQRIPPKKGTP